LTKVPASHVLFLGQTHDGVVFGFHANCPLSGDVRRRDPALKSAIFVLEHPTGEQRKWQLQDANYDVSLSEEFLDVGVGFSVDSLGWLYCGQAPEFGMMEEDASFISVRPAGHEEWLLAQIDRWELWSV
jgi:hypothetical protein